MKFCIALLASAIGLSLAGLSAAEPPTGSRLGERMKSGTGDDEVTAARRGHQLANCIINRRRAKAEALMAQTTSEGYSGAFKTMTSGEFDCLTMFDDATDITAARSFKIPQDVMRGLLAEELIKSDLRRFAMLPTLPTQMTYSRTWYAGTSRHVAVDEMATCVSESAPAETLALLQAEPYSDAEQAAFGALGPHLGACLRIGTKVDANRQTLRAALADALYQRVASPPPPAPQNASAK